MVVEDKMILLRKKKSKLYSLDEGNTLSFLCTSISIYRSKINFLQSFDASTKYIFHCVDDIIEMKLGRKHR